MCRLASYFFAHYIYILYIWSYRNRRTPSTHQNTSRHTHSTRTNRSSVAYQCETYIFKERVLSHTSSVCVYFLCVGGYHYYHRGQCVYFACEYSIRVPDDVSDKTTHTTVLFYVRPKHNLTLKGSLVRLNTNATHFLLCTK